MKKLPLALKSLFNINSCRKRARNFFLLISCFAYASFRPKMPAALSDPKKLLVIQSAKLGDMVCTTPVFRAIKKAYPQSELIVMGDGVNEKVLALNPDVDRYLVINNESVSSQIKLFKSLKLDYACIACPQSEYLAELYLAGVPLIVVPKIENGYCQVETKAYKSLCRLVKTVPHRMKNYAPREYLRLLEPIGIVTDDTGKHAYFSAEADKRMSALLSHFPRPEKSRLVGILPGAGNKIKQWSGKKFATVAEYVAKNLGAVVVIIGGKADQSEAEEMKRAMGSDIKYLDTVNKISIDELKALISKLDLLIGVDTGSIYIAESFSVPTIDIVGPVDEREQPPIGEKHLIVKNRGDRPPQLFVMNGRTYNEAEALRQINDIDPSMVIDSINRIMLV